MSKTDLFRARHGMKFWPHPEVSKELD